MRTIWSALLLFSFSCLFALSFPVTCVAQEIDWWAVKNDVGLKLSEGEFDLIDWASELADLDPTTPQEAVVKANVMMRVGLNDETIAALQSLKSLQAEGESPTNYLLSSIYYAATDEYEAWDVAAKVAEIFDADIQEMSIENRLLRHWEETEGRDADEIDAWLAQRVANAVEAEADRGLSVQQQRRNRMFGQPTPAQFWRTVRLRHLAKHGRADAFLQELEQEVRENPDDVEKAVVYLEMLNMGFNSADERNSLDLAWMIDLCEIERATDASNLGDRFGYLEKWNEAVAMHRLAVSTPVTDAELEEISMMCQAFLPMETHRHHFEVRVLESLSKSLLELGVTEESQAVMVQAADIREKYGLGLNPYLSGLVQSASGAREIEGRIQEREELSQDDPAYWLERASYYRGRANEQDEEEKALLAALELCDPLPRPQGKTNGTLRAQAVREYARFLERNEREEDAVEFLLTELNDVPVDSESSEAAARFIAYDLPGYINPDEPIYWLWLERRPAWEHTEERLLWRLLESTLDNSSAGIRTPFSGNRIPGGDGGESVARIPDKLNSAFQTAEAMTIDADPTRAAVLGWVMNRMGCPGRSLDVLQYAIENVSENEELKGRASFTLFESYLDIGDWRSAEAIYSNAANRLTAHEQPDWIGRIAILAALDGEMEDADRLWRRSANMNPRDASLVQQLARAGLREQLIAYYDELEQRLPGSVVPDEMRAVITATP